MVFERFKRFNNRREDLQDGPESGRPSTSRNADTIANPWNGDMGSSMGSQKDGRWIKQK
jgi:hypothetical protein